MLPTADGIRPVVGLLQLMNEGFGFATFAEQCLGRAQYIGDEMRRRGIVDSIVGAGLAR